MPANSPRGRPTNPFEFGRELGADELVDREEELELVRRTAENRGKLFLIGPRRFGKTSIMKAAEDQLEEAGMIVLRFNVEAYESLGLLARAILTKATRKLSSSVEKAAGLLKDFFAGLRPELTFDPRTETVGVRLVRAPSRDEELPMITEALDGLDRWAGASSSPVVVMIDEFQQLTLDHGISAERQLRASIQEHRHVAYVFAGSKTSMLAEMTGDPKRPFYRMGARCFVGAIPRPDFVEFLRMSFENSGFRAEDEALVHLLDRAGDVPFNVQQLAHYAWDRLRSSDAAMLTDAIVDHALDRIVREDDPFYTQLWNGLTLSQKKAFKAVITFEGKDLYSAAVSREVQMATSSMQSALGTLQEKDVIRAEEASGEKRYVLEDPFFAAWLDMVQEV